MRVVGFANPIPHSLSEKPMFLRMELPSGRIRFCSCPLWQPPRDLKAHAAGRTYSAVFRVRPEPQQAEHQLLAVHSRRKLNISPDMEFIHGEKDGQNYLQPLTSSSSLPSPTTERHGHQSTNAHYSRIINAP